MAKLFGTEDSPSFVNGVLDKLSKNFKEKDFVIEKQQKASMPDSGIEAGTATHDDSPH
ncbi:transcription antitermination protein NusB [compost metagenome]